MASAIGIQLVLYGFGWLMAAVLLPQERRCMAFWSAYAFLQGISALLVADDLAPGRLPGASALMIGVAGYAAALLGVEAYAGQQRRLNAWMLAVLGVTVPCAALGQMYVPNEADLRAVLVVCYSGSGTLIAAIATPRLWSHLRVLHNRRVSAIALLPSTLVGLQAFANLLLFALHVPIGSHRGEANQANLLLGMLTTGMFNLCYLFLVTSRIVERLRDVTRFDHLTGVFSRSEAEARLRWNLQLLARKGGACCVAMIDVDHFKRLNDQFGHAYGDECLKMVTRALQSELRRYDVLGRWGGDEFILVLPETGLEESRRVLNRLLEAVQKAARKTEKVEISLSIGAVVAMRQLREHAPEEVLAKADQALYRAKAAGRARVEFDSATN